MLRSLLLSFAIVTLCFANAATFTVTSSADGTTTDGVSLRWAITQANSSNGVDTIAFNIPGMPPHVIGINTLLPNVGTGNVYINGLSQPANSYTGPEPKIVIQDNAGLAQALYFFATTASKVDGIWCRDFNSYGIYAFGSSINVTVDMCKLSNNQTNGVYLVGSNANLIIRNSTVWGNGTDGIDVFGAGAYCTIENNLVSSNGATGILINGGSAPSVIKGNRVGTDSSGTMPAPNVSHGILVNTNSNLIGGPLVGEGNTVAYNFGDGIRISIGDFNLVTRNSLFCNAGLGINLVTGGNSNFASPVITSATTAAAGGTAVANSRIELYYDTSCVGCEGKNFIATLNADAAGNWNYSGPLTLNSLITATAIDTANDNTSRFSACMQVMTVGQGEGFTPGNFMLYPNPSIGIVFIKVGEGVGEVEVYNILGEKIIQTSIIASGTHEIKLDLSGNAPGIYFIQLVGSNKRLIGKVLLLD